jgi:hypothetical protein
MSVHKLVRNKCENKKVAGFRTLCSYTDLDNDSYMDFNENFKLVKDKDNYHKILKECIKTELDPPSSYISHTVSSSEDEADVIDRQLCILAKSSSLGHYKIMVYAYNLSHDQIVDFNTIVSKIIKEILAEHKIEMAKKTNKRKLQELKRKEQEANESGSESGSDDTGANQENGNDDDEDDDEEDDDDDEEYKVESDESESETSESSEDAEAEEEKEKKAKPKQKQNKNKKQKKEATVTTKEFVEPDDDNDDNDK